jgi:hypothetical protein
MVAQLMARVGTIQWMPENDVQLPDSQFTTTSKIQNLCKSIPEPKHSNRHENTFNAAEIQPALRRTRESLAIAHGKLFLVNAQNRRKRGTNTHGWTIRVSVISFSGTKVYQPYQKKLHHSPGY